MTGGYEKDVRRFLFGSDPLEDPLVSSWDAVVRGDQATPPGSDLADIALFHSFHALEQIPSPTPGFFATLERHITELAPASPGVVQDLRVLLAPTTVRPVLNSSSAGESLSWPARAGSAHPIPGSHNHQWLPQQSALAALVVLLIVGLLVLYQANLSPAEPAAIPAAVIAAPTMEPLAQLEFTAPIWEMADPTTWDHMEASFMELEPGKSFTTDHDWYTSVDGPLLITVFSGTLSITPGGPAFYYAADDPHQSVKVSAGQAVLLQPDDTIVYSARGAAIGTNLGAEPMEGIYGLAGKVLYTPDTGTEPTDVNLSNIFAFDTMPSLPANGASISVQRLELAPYDSYVFDPTPNFRYLPQVDWQNAKGLRMFVGEFDGLPVESNGQSLHGPAALIIRIHKPRTLVNFGDETVDLYFLVVEPYPDTATPSA